MEAELHDLNLQEMVSAFFYLSCIKNITRADRSFICTVIVCAALMFWSSWTLPSWNSEILVMHQTNLIIVSPFPHRKVWWTMAQMTMGKVGRKERKTQTAALTRASCPPRGPSSSPSSCRWSQRGHQMLLTEPRAPWENTGGSYLIRGKLVFHFSSFSLDDFVTYQRLWAKTQVTDLMWKKKGHTLLLSFFVYKKKGKNCQKTWFLVNN